MCGSVQLTRVALGRLNLETVRKDIVWKHADPFEQINAKVGKVTFKY